MRPAAYERNATPATLVFGYTVAADDTDDNGVAVPENGILLAGGTIAGSHGVALLGHDAVAADAAHMVDGSNAALTGGVCDRTPQVRDALVAAVAGGERLLGGHRDPARRPRRHAAARGPGHCGPEGR